MFVINEDLSIYVTRGDAAAFSVGATLDGTAYTFKADDIVRFKVFAKKDCADVVLQKDVKATEGASVVEIALDKEDTKIGETISKPVDYWYEVEMNPDTYPQTIIGYDENGAKVFKLFPEGGGVDE